MTDEPHRKMSCQQDNMRPLTDAEYLALCKANGVADDGTWPSLEQAKARYAADHELVVNGRTIRFTDLRE